MFRSIRLSHLVAVLSLASVWACGEGPGAAGISRGAFVDTYVELRVAALRTEVGDLPDSARSRILTERGLTEGDLLDFVAARGADFVFMRELWNEIEQQLDSVPPLGVEVVP